MSDYIVDIDEELLGLFEDHDEVMYLSFLSIINSLTSKSLIKNDHWIHERIDIPNHIRRRLHDNSFRKTYRMDINSFMILYDMLFPYIEHDKNYSRCQVPITKVMIVLTGVRYLAGAKYDFLQDIIGSSYRTIYYLRDKFLDAVEACPELQIKYPDDLNVIKNGFKEKSREGIMSNCVGCIDSFFQPTKAPGKNECNHNQLVHYSGHYESYGLNCQAVCDHKLRFIYFGVVGPGSMNDAVAFRHTNIKEKILDHLEEGDYMLGDAAYPISEKLLVQPFV